MAINDTGIGGLVYWLVLLLGVVGAGTVILMSLFGEDDEDGDD